MTPAFEHIQVRESFFDRALNHLSKPQYSHESDAGCATHGESNRRYVGNVIENAPEEMLVHGSKDFRFLGFLLISSIYKDTDQNSQQQ